MTVIGSVPYLNARPLVRRFEVEDRGVEVRYAVPTRLPAMLDSGEARAVLMSSVEALRAPGRRIADGVCIGSHGPVRSVRLFSRLRFDRVRTLALDASSMTSNRLAEVLLAELFGKRPETRTHAPDLGAMLDRADACVLIGDIGMRARSEGLHVLDLGEAWHGLTGLPFVWAAWLGAAGLTPELADELREAARWSGCGRRVGPPTSCATGDRHAQREALIREACERDDWPEAQAREYLTEAMVYDMDARALEGFRAFQSLLLRHGFDDCDRFPQRV